MELKINGLQHIGIPVTNLKQSESFYEGLGFENVMTSHFVINKKNGRIDHIAFDVDDIDFTYNTLIEQGYTVLEEAPVFLNFWTKGCKYFNILGPDGERLEFNQILK
jgi:lactoylglutathione lyase